ncbi:hypothetical protein C488_04732 [Natrinema pellirubrum DSM 15624]|uniref:Uncharacterized protein n=1 Tax=Natrinema pellirubrum (strain DSM 15624 / CIP 106293 / JCM 10476 / NCIMB 786 / 157) TaxID=797303 RepID=L0JGD8_NATP1|nr:hypothetical protein [Natrinema pellirubrum]AGB30349.1 hypothetical protein Natpe_0418 [Natrinema pellirubrum DSM 15624]ELY79271.1 hypothetical protein C488_04732 [Natrinema pellirubrum DSM 15624]
MVAARSRNPRLILFGVVLALLPIGLLAGRSLEFATDRLTISGVVVGVVLVVVALAIPVLLLASWQAETESR